MKGRSIALSTVVLLAVAAQSAQAQCAFDQPGKAKGGKFSLVRSYSPCPGFTFPTPGVINSQTGSGTPSCAPPYAHSSFLFSDKGGCTVKISHKVEDPCSFNSVTRTCANLSISAKCSGILESDGVTLIDTSGWSLMTITRWTLDDEDNGDMTVIDFPIQIPFGVPVKGTMSVATDSNHLLDDLGLTSFPACIGVEIVSVSVQDPGGNPFAVPGSGSTGP